MNEVNPCYNEIGLAEQAYEQVYRQQARPPLDRPISIVTDLRAFQKGASDDTVSRLPDRSRLFVNNRRLAKAC